MGVLVVLEEICVLELLLHRLSLPCARLCTRALPLDKVFAGILAPEIEVRRFNCTSAGKTGMQRNRSKFQMRAER